MLMQKQNRILEKQISELRRLRHASGTPMGFNGAGMSGGCDGGYVPPKDRKFKLSNCDEKDPDNVRKCIRRNKAPDDTLKSIVNAIANVFPSKKVIRNALTDHYYQHGFVDIEHIGRELVKSSVNMFDAMKSDFDSANITDVLIARNIPKTGAQKRPRVPKAPTTHRALVRVTGPVPRPRYRMPSMGNMTPDPVNMLPRQSQQYHMTTTKGKRRQRIYRASAGRRPPTHTHKDYRAWVAYKNTNLGQNNLRYDDMKPGSAERSEFVNNFYNSRP